MRVKVEKLAKSQPSPLENHPNSSIKTSIGLDLHRFLKLQTLEIEPKSAYASEIVPQNPYKIRF
jgi:hypothetical protein